MSKEKKELCIDYTYYETSIPENYGKRTGHSIPDPCEIRAFIPGTIIEVNVRKGQHVAAGQDVLILEAMKMYNDVATEVTGKVVEINVSAGDSVEKNQLMIRIEE